MDPALIARLDQMKAEYDDLLPKLGEAAGDRQRYAELAKRASELGEVVGLYRDYREAEAEEREARDLLREAADPEEEDFYKSTAERAQRNREKLEGVIAELLMPRDPRDDRNVIVEIRKGTGGDEAALFAAELFRMYQRFAERQGWKTDVLDVSESGVGGMNEVVFEVKGKGAFSKLKYESGVHRVQRVPVTESGGRIHTSAATVAVLPEVEDVEVDVAEKDLKVDTFRSSGPGGQHVNTTDSAVRITHLPTNIVVSCQSERSQLQNRDRAMRVLRAKLQERAEAEARAQLASERRSQVGTGDRSEKIRTYNFPQNRVTDHRIGYDVHNLPKFMDGEIEDMLEALGRSDGRED